MTTHSVHETSSPTAAPASAPGSERADEFRRDVADMRFRAPSERRERLLLVGSVVAMAAGVVLALVAWLTARGASDALTQRDSQTMAIFALVLAVVGGAVFLRCSIARLLRFWLARMTFEQGVQTDRLLDVLDDGR
jgi:hypothetical protein